jgi:hypothetical protein
MRDMSKIPHNASLRFTHTRNDALVKKVLFLKLVASGYECDNAQRRDIINRMMEPIGTHRLKALAEECLKRHNDAI